ncbi:ATP-dependent helicase HepA [Sinorhizobium fredii]|uniref:SNF2-like protein n=1 Tax=Sinorhizobium fredii (strain USDA 257) TaxID=1185652 RepID=I3WZH4_SINF2|nr:SNF2-related protein [Sinorhizobium fredii]AFL49030.1 SNF2-like protein [Sinorhizobium fredii USDA 257]
MLGYLVQHRLFGCCKVIGFDGRTVDIKFCDGGGRRFFSRSALEGGDFKRAKLHTGALAMGPHGQCAIDALIDGDGEGPRHYRITYEDGLGATVSEVQLLPLPVRLSDSLPARLLQGRTDPYATFSARHRLLVALARFNRQVGGLRALLASRIDLHPHQAFVAGTVILDPVRRYILADEVGLGKTIEAGLIMHDLLSRRPHARILVLTPGPLTRQWLCEMHTSFGGQGFKLADLYPFESVDLGRWSKVICSTNFALDGLDEDLLAVPWDLVVVDEVHHLLNARHLYDLVMQLSHSTRDLLLLSAVPVRRRESELYRLLALLDPQTYGKDGTGEEAFLAIYQAQEPLGRRLNLLSHDLTDLESGEATSGDVIARLERLLSLPIVQNDEQLHALLAAAEADPERAGALAQEAHQTISDRYRVNRRILRNRRERLISQDRLAAITRVPALLRYEPDQIEGEAVTAAEAMLAALAADTNLSPDILRPFSRILLQALVDPIATLEVLTAVRDAKAATVNSYGREMLNSVVGLGGERWRIQLDTVSAGVKAHVDPGLLSSAVRLASNWRSSHTSSVRWEALVSLLRGEIAAGRKTLVFAGFPGVAQRLAALLKNALGEKSVTEFRSDLEDMAKEENVGRFRAEANVSIMVSDESGGEGRNFQFAHSLIHADLPWQPAVIEQRIGRLDRLGREVISSEVVSHILVSADTWEAGLYACYHDGLDLFGKSVSGLEFALRHLQDEIIDAALTGGQDGMHDLTARLKAIAAEERVRDDSEALLDEASYHAARAERFVRTPSAESELALEAAFLDYFRVLSGGRGVSRHQSADGAEGVWCLRPDNVPYGEITIIDKDATGETGKRVGTFRRKLAQQQRRVEFFTYGNPLFDAVVESVGQRLTGRTYAIACQAVGATSFIGLELIIAAQPRLNASDISPSLLNLAEAIFGAQRRQLFVPLLPGQPVEGSRLAGMLTSLSTKGGGPHWRDLTGDQVQQLVRRFDGDLSTCLNRAMEQLIPAARGVFAKALAEPLASERERIAFQRHQLIKGSDAAGAAEAVMLERYSALIDSWDVVIDGIGFLAVNVRC